MLYYYDFPFSSDKHFYVLYECSFYLKNVWIKVGCGFQIIISLNSIPILRHHNHVFFLVSFYLVCLWNSSLSNHIVTFHGKIVYIIWRWYFNALQISCRDFLWCDVDILLYYWISCFIIMVLRMSYNYQILLLIVCFHTNTIIFFFYMYGHDNYFYNMLSYFTVFTHVLCMRPHCCTNSSWPILTRFICLCSKGGSRGVGHSFPLTYDDYLTLPGCHIMLT